MRMDVFELIFLCYTSNDVKYNDTVFKVQHRVIANIAGRLASSIIYVNLCNFCNRKFANDNFLNSFIYWRLCCSQLETRQPQNAIEIALNRVVTWVACYGIIVRLEFAFFTSCYGISKDRAFFAF
jgi:hypothetical protein